MKTTHHSFYKIILTLGFIFLFIPTIGFALKTNQDSITNGQVTVERPSERWRVEHNSENDLIRLKYLRHGKDILIRIFERESIYHHNKNFFKVRSKNEQKTVKHILLKDYIKQGFRFVEYNRTKTDISAIGVDKDQRYILLHFVPYTGDYRATITVAETILEYEDFIPFRDSFYKVAKSLEIR